MLLDLIGSELSWVQVRRMVQLALLVGNFSIVEELLMVVHDHNEKYREGVRKRVEQYRLSHEQAKPFSKVRTEHSFLIGRSARN